MVGIIVGGSVDVGAAMVGVSPELGLGVFPVGIRVVSVGGTGVGVEGENVRVGIRVEVARPSKGLAKREPALALMVRKMAPVRMINPNAMKRLICQGENR